MRDSFRTLDLRRNLMGFKILETAYFLPKNIVKNDIYEKKFDLKAGWIEQRTGIIQRHVADSDVYSSDLACNAIDQLNGFHDTEFIICTSSTPDSLLPSNANRIAQKLALDQIVCFDLMSGCSSFLYGLIVANSLLDSGLFKRGLVVGTEKMEMIIDQNDRVTSPIFGDSAAVWFIEHIGDKNIKALHWESDSKGVDDLYIPIINQNNVESLPQPKVVMNGKHVFKNAVNKMSESILKSLNAAGMTIDDIDYLIPHQANKRIIQEVGIKIGFPEEKILISITQLGNVVSSSIPITYHMNKEKLSGKNILLVAFGAGYNFGSMIVNNH
jgi:3-oxoacyl-[acyl-carrier-protein] synthase-3